MNTEQVTLAVGARLAQCGVSLTPDRRAMLRTFLRFARDTFDYTDSRGRYTIVDRATGYMLDEVLNG